MWVCEGIAFFPGLVCNICKAGMTLTQRLRVSPPTFDVFSQWGRFIPVSHKIYIVEGSPVVHPGVRGTIVAIEARNARIAAIVRSAESKKAAQAGAKEIHLMAIRPTIANLRIFRDAASQRAIFMES